MSSAVIGNTAFATPVAAAVRRIDTADGPAFEFRIGPDEPVFAGHYPGYPIFPGVCLVECVHRVARDTVPANPTRRADGGGTPVLLAIESARFLAPVLPGDTITVTTVWSDAGGGQWQCAGTVWTDRGRAASVRLRFGTGDRP